MEYDTDKVDEMVLALLYLTMFDENQYGRPGVEIARLGRDGPSA